MSESGHKIEVFTGSCRLCEAAVDLVQNQIKDRATLEIKSIEREDAKAYGLTSVPSIVADGKLLFSRLPEAEELEVALQGALR